LLPFPLCAQKAGEESADKPGKQKTPYTLTLVELCAALYDVRNSWASFGVFDTPVIRVLHKEYVAKYTRPALAVLLQKMDGPIRARLHQVRKEDAKFLDAEIAKAKKEQKNGASARKKAKVAQDQAQVVQEAGSAAAAQLVQQSDGGAAGSVVPQPEAQPNVPEAESKEADPMDVDVDEDPHDDGDEPGENGKATDPSLKEWEDAGFGIGRVAEHVVPEVDQDGDAPMPDKSAKKAVPLSQQHHRQIPRGVKPVLEGPGADDDDEDAVNSSSSSSSDEGDDDGDGDGKTPAAVVSMSPSSDEDVLRPRKSASPTELKSPRRRSAKRAPAAAVGDGALLPPRRPTNNRSSAKGVRATSRVCRAGVCSPLWEV